MSDEINGRLQILEEKFAHQELMIDALNEVIIEQQGQIDTIEAQLRRLRDQLAAIHDQSSGSPDSPPPHY